MAALHGSCSPASARPGAPHVDGAGILNRHCGVQTWHRARSVPEALLGGGRDGRGGVVASGLASAAAVGPPQAAERRRFRGDVAGGLTARAVGSGGSSGEDVDAPPPGCSRVKVELNRPIGIIFEERKGGGIFVADLVEEGRAAQSGLVGVGDELIATSAVVFSDSDFYGGVEVRKGMRVVRIPTGGESFDSIMAAIGTHPGYMKVTLELQKCKDPE